MSISSEVMRGKNVTADGHPGLCRVARWLSLSAIAALAAGLWQAQAAAQGDARNVEVNGFVLGTFSGRTTGLGPAGGDDFIVAEERFRFDVNAWSESVEASALVKGDLLHDAVAGAFELDLREAYVDYSTGPLDLRLGRQIVTWGVGDLIFINDVFPKDWVSFFAGRPLEYLKLGVDALRVGYSTDLLSADVVVDPFFRGDVLPDPSLFSLFDPFQEVSKRTELLPERSYENVQVAMRVYRRLAGFDVAAYAYKGFWHMPSPTPGSLSASDSIEFSYPELSVYGISAQGGAVGGILSLEGGYYDSRQDRNGTQATLPNSEARLLAGYQRQLSEDFTVAVQYYAELMMHHDRYLKSVETMPFPARREYRDIVTLRLDRFLSYQTWRLSLFGFYGMAEGDYLIQPLISYRFSDELTLSVGGNVFGGGGRAAFFGQFDGNDNAYVNVRFDF